MGAFLVVLQKFQLLDDYQNAHTRAKCVPILVHLQLEPVKCMCMRKCHQCELPKIGAYPLSWIALCEAQLGSIQGSL